MSEQSKARLYVSGNPAALPGENDEQYAPWWSTPYGRKRLEFEIEAMKRYPGFRLFFDQALLWRGRIESDFSGKSYDVEVCYSINFPDTPPLVRITNQSFPSLTPHLLGGDRPCLYMTDHGPRSGYDPASTTAATLIAWTALWVHAYETWLLTKRWPGLQA